MMQFDDLVREVREEFPAFKVVKKYDSGFMRLIDFLLRVVTIGRMTTFMTDFITTIGWTMYVPTSWVRHTDASKCIVLLHERVHLRQQKKYTRPLFAILYLFVFLPMGLAWFRAKFEKEAYEVTIRERAKAYGISHVTSPAGREGIIENFVGPSYGWMWPFRKSLERWYDSIVASLE